MKQHTASQTNRPTTARKPSTRRRAARPDATPGARGRDRGSADDGEKILTTRELLDRIPLDRSTIWRMTKENRFPQPIQLTPSRIGWRWSAVEKWLTERERNRIQARPYFGRGDRDAAAVSR